MNIKGLTKSKLITAFFKELNKVQRIKFIGILMAINTDMATDEDHLFWQMSNIISSLIEYED